MKEQSKVIRFVDLFAGLGGTRIGLEQACKELGLKSKCVFSCDIKKSAVDAYKKNFGEDILCDIKNVDENSIDDFDILLAGFPCQPFSRAGSKRGFADTRGTMFFEIERILKARKPKYVFLENVAELSTHSKGRTLSVIINNLEQIGYKVSWKVLDSQDFGLPQSRRRIYIVGVLDVDEAFNFDMLSTTKPTKVKDIREYGLSTLDTDFAKKLVESYPVKQLPGLVISDKRRGDKTIHSWNIGYKGEVSEEENFLLETIISNFRKRKFADDLGVKWRDGMPLNIEQLKEITKWSKTKVRQTAESLVSKGYLCKKHPYYDDRLEERRDLPVGYRVMTGRVSFELNRILDDNGLCVTLTATDASHIGVVDEDGVRRLNTRECLRLFGFPDSYDLSSATEDEMYDLVGNSICVNVVKEILEKCLSFYE